MSMKREDTLNPTLSPSTDLLNPTEIIEAMIELDAPPNPQRGGLPMTDRNRNKP